MRDFIVPGDLAEVALETPFAARKQRGCAIEAPLACRLVSLRCAWSKLWEIVALRRRRSARLQAYLKKIVAVPEILVSY
jgi:hypothetical protein